MRISSVIKFNSRTTKDLFRCFYTIIIMHTVFLIRHRLKFSLKRLLYSVHNNEQFCIKRYRDLQSMESNSTPSKVTRAPRKRHKREREREREIGGERKSERIDERRDGKRSENRVPYPLRRREERLARWEAEYRQINAPGPMDQPSSISLTRQQDFIGTREIREFFMRDSRRCRGGKEQKRNRNKATIKK